MHYESFQQQIFLVNNCDTIDTAQSCTTIQRTAFCITRPTLTTQFFNIIIINVPHSITQKLQCKKWQTFLCVQGCQHWQWL